MEKDKGVSRGFMQLINEELNSFTPYAPPTTIEELEERVIADSKAGRYKRPEVIIDSRIVAKFNNQMKQKKGEGGISTILFVEKSAITKMKKDKGPRFTVYIFENPEKIEIKDRDGNIGEVYKLLESYLVRITTTNLTDEDKKLKLAKSMQFWYYNTQVKQPK